MPLTPIQKQNIQRLDSATAIEILHEETGMNKRTMLRTCKKG